jgi:multiple sugar transport system permease protein
VGRGRSAPSGVAVREEGIHQSRLRFRDNLAGFLFISPWLLGFLAFLIIPIVSSLYYSFSDYHILDEPIFSGIDNFREMMHDRYFWKSLQVTFSYAFTSVPLRLIFAFFVALLFNRRGRGVYVYQLVYYIPSIIGGSIAIAVMWRRLFMPDGAFNAVLGSLGLRADINWIGNPDTALGTLVVLAVWQFGSSMLIFLAGLKQIPESYYDAASIDGAGAIAKFFRITIPFMTPIIFFNLVMQMVHGFTVFTQAFVVSGGTGDPLNSTLVYALYLYQRAFRYYEMGYSSALAWVLVLIIGVFTALIFRSSRFWVYYETKDGR